MKTVMDWIGWACCGAVFQIHERFGERIPEGGWLDRATSWLYRRGCAAYGWGCEGSGRTNDPQL